MRSVFTKTESPASLGRLRKKLAASRRKVRALRTAERFSI